MTVSNAVEEWKPVPGASLVEVSTEGLVWSHRSGQLLAQTPNSKGYLRVRYINDAGERVTEAVGPLVLTVHVGPRPVDRKGRRMECCHGQGGRQDNSLRNVRWDTDAANRRDRYGERRWWRRPFVALRNRLAGGDGE